jgi:hypothetical protein
MMHCSVHVIIISVKLRKTLQMSNNFKYDGLELEVKFDQLKHL